MYRYNIHIYFFQAWQITNRVLFFLLQVSFGGAFWYPDQIKGNCIQMNVDYLDETFVELVFSDLREKKTVFWSRPPGGANQKWSTN